MTSSESFGVAITTCNRQKLFEKTYKEFDSHTPDSVPIFIVDDGSHQPVLGSHWRNESPRGIAWAKNKCLELLMDAKVDHLFLFDDDCYPVEDNWWEEYTNSGESHLAHLFIPSWDKETRIVVPYRKGEVWAASSGTGCLLYYTRECIEKVGGMRTVFGKRSFEHIEHSQRIHNFGLTRFPFQGLNTCKIFSEDEAISLDKESSAKLQSIEDRQLYRRNRDLYYNLYKDREPEFVEYRMD